MQCVSFGFFMNKLNNIKNTAICAVVSGLLMSGCAVNKTNKSESLSEVLSQVHACNESIEIRSQQLTKLQITEACDTLVSIESRFHDIFNTKGKPVADDFNDVMRANVYHTRDEYVRYATENFNMPTDNGGMYLEGYPDKKGNHAEFVAYERQGKIWNLRHEFVHYLDGRFNKYGDYCNGLHDDHAGPEFCASPNLAYPHVVWWAEGVGEYIAHGDNNQAAIKLAQQQVYQLSELFNTSSNTNTGSNRVYRWGYLAVRFMMEQQRPEVETMLETLRQGDWSGYQKLVTSWGTRFDNDFSIWLVKLSKLM